MKNRKAFPCLPGSSRDQLDLDRRLIGDIVAHDRCQPFRLNAAPDKLLRGAAEGSAAASMPLAFHN